MTVQPSHRVSAPKPDSSRIHALCIVILAQEDAIANLWATRHLLIHREAIRAYVRTARRAYAELAPLVDERTRESEWEDDPLTQWLVHLNPDGLKLDDIGQYIGGLSRERIRQITEASCTRLGERHPELLEVLLEFIESKRTSMWDAIEEGAALDVIDSAPSDGGSHAAPKPWKGRVYGGLLVVSERYNDAAHSELCMETKCLSCGEVAVRRTADVKRNRSGCVKCVRKVAKGRNSSFFAGES